jgi:hypothetical protein
MFEKRWKQEDFNPGISNSVSYAGHILTKKGSRATLIGKNVSAGRNRTLKVHLYYKKQYFQQYFE